MTSSRCMQKFSDLPYFGMATFGRSGDTLRLPPQAVMNVVKVSVPETLGKVTCAEFPSGHEAWVGLVLGVHETKNEAWPPLGDSVTAVTGSTGCPATPPSVTFVLSGPSDPMRSRVG